MASSPVSGRAASSDQGSSTIPTGLADDLLPPFARTSRWLILGVILLGLIIALATAWFVDRQVTVLMLDDVTLRAIDQVELGIQGLVTADDLAPPHGEAQLAGLAARLAPLLPVLHRNGVIRLNIFARDGTIVYSDAPGLIGRRPEPDTDLLQQGMAGRIGREISALDGPENADLRGRFSGALEVYVPIRANGQVIGVYELYQDLAPVEQVRPAVWSTVFGVLIPLFLALGILARGASSRVAREQAEREILLRQAAEADTLRRLDRLKSELLSAVSHELRTPLTIVHGYAELLAARTERYDTEEIREIAQEIRRGAALMTRVVDDLGDYCRVERGRLRLDPQEIDVRDVVSETIEIFRRQRGGDRLDPAFPPEPVIARADPVRITQVVSNLIANALRYAPTGPIHVRVAREDDCALIEVRDHGPGISPEALPHIWEMYYRAPEVVSSIAGTGIGLALVKSLVDAHGGTVEAESTPGQGAVFRVHLPVQGPDRPGTSVPLAANGRLDHLPAPAPGTATLPSGPAVTDPDSPTPGAAVVA